MDAESAVCPSSTWLGSLSTWIWVCILLCCPAGWLLIDPFIRLFLRDGPGRAVGPACLPTILEEEAEEAEGSDEEEKVPHAAHHASNAGRQQAAALHEAGVMASSPRVDAPSSSLGESWEAARVLKREGLVRINGVVGGWDGSTIKCDFDFASAWVIFWCCAHSHAFRWSLRPGSAEPHQHQAGCSIDGQSS